MNDAWGYDETDDTDVSGGPKPLRDAYKAQKKANDELMQRLAALEAQSKNAQVKDLFESQGLPRSAAKYYNGDATEDAITAFVTDMRNAFGGVPVQPSTPVATTPAISPSDQQKLQAMMQAGADGNTAGNYDVAMNAMSDPNLSTADRIAAWQNFARNSGNTQ